MDYRICIALPDFIAWALGTKEVKRLMGEHAMREMRLSGWPEGAGEAAFRYLPDDKLENHTTFFFSTPIDVSQGVKPHHLKVQYEILEWPGAIPIIHDEDSRK